MVEWGKRMREIDGTQEGGRGGLWQRGGTWLRAGRRKYDASQPNTGSRRRRDTHVCLYDRERTRGSRVGRRV